MFRGGHRPPAEGPRSPEGVWEREGECGAGSERAVRRGQGAACGPFDQMPEQGQRGREEAATWSSSPGRLPGSPPPASSRASPSPPVSTRMTVSRGVVPASLCRQSTHSEPRSGVGSDLLWLRPMNQLLLQRRPLPDTNLGLPLGRLCGSGTRGGRKLRWFPGPWVPGPPRTPGAGPADGEVSGRLPCLSHSVACPCAWVLTPDPWGGDAVPRQGPARLPRPLAYLQLPA